MDGVEFNTLADGTVTLKLGALHFDFGGQYHVAYDAGVFKDAGHGLAASALTDATTVNFGTVVPAANTTGSSSVRFDAVSGASDSGMTYVSAHQGVPGPDTGKVTLDLSAGNFAVVSALDAQSGGTNALGQGFVYLTNFSAGDVLYLDNFGNRSQPLVPLTDAWFTSDEQATSVSLTDPLRVSSNSLFTTEQQWVQLQAGAPVNNIGLFGDQAVLDHYSQHTALIFA